MTIYSAGFIRNPRGRRDGGGVEGMQVYCKTGGVVMLVTYIRDLYGTNVI